MSSCAPFLSLLFFLYIYVCISTNHVFLSLLFCVLQAELKPISINHPTTKEVSVAMGTPMEGFFNGANVVVETMASAATTTAQGVPFETLIPSTEPGPIEEGAQTKGVSEPTFIPVETPTPQKGVTPSTAS